MPFLWSLPIAKGVGRVYRRESSNLSISANKKTTRMGGFFVGGRDLNASAREGDLPHAAGGGRSGANRVNKQGETRAGERRVSTMFVRCGEGDGEWKWAVDTNRCPFCFLAETRD